MSPPLHVLVVDDEEPIRRNFRACLEDLGYRVTVASNGREALEAVSREHHDAVLTDLRMPEMDGMELVRAIRVQSPLIPVVVVSGKGDVREAIAAINEGAWDYVIKPVEHGGQLDVVIKRAIDRARLIGENRQYQANLEALVAARTAELYERERTLRVVADNTFDWEWWRAPDGRFIYCSPSCVRITGYSREDFLGDATIFDRIVHPDDRQRLGQHHATDRGAPAPDAFEFRIVHRDGTIRWMEHVCQPILADDGTWLGQRGSNRDSTDRKRLETQVLRMQRQESLARISSGIAHDLNNILAPILMAGELLQTAGLTGRPQQCVDVLRTSAVRGAELVKQLLLYSRGGDGRRVKVDVCRLVRDSARLVTETFPKNIEIRQHLPSDVWPIEADPTQIHQVLLNLCVNARDAMPEGGSLAIAVEHVELDEDVRLSNCWARPGPYVVLTVVDSGTGIPADALDKIFDPFFTTKPQGEGTGLGLSTVQGIVASHGGCIEVRSRPGEGSQFSVYFPAAPGSSLGAGSEPGRVPHAGEGQTILVVEDEELVREMIRRVLEANGYRVLVADGGLQALEMYRRNLGAVDVVLTDIWMPHLDGLATIQRLAQIDPGARVIAMSGLPESRDKAFRASRVVRQFLAKPWHRNQLLAALREVLETADRGDLA